MAARLRCLSIAQGPQAAMLPTVQLVSTVQSILAMSTLQCQGLVEIAFNVAATVQAWGQQGMHQRLSLPLSTYHAAN